jgi:signal transduction histidine kinase
VEAVLTFTELREMWGEDEDKVSNVEPSEFDPPHPALGALFPITRGMLQAAGVSEDLLRGDVVAADGRHSFAPAVAEFEAGGLNVRLLEVLCCPGCIMGSGMSIEAPLFRRREAVSQYVRTQVVQRSADDDAIAKRLRGNVDLSARFEPRPVPMPPSDPEIIRQILARMGKTDPADELNCGACGYLTCREHAAAISYGLAESEMCLPYTIERLRKSLEDLNRSNASLASAREALMNAEKLASMGQLAAGIAHEINNPLGVILLYARLLLDELPESADEREDVRLIAEQAERCKKIVAGLLHFSRRNRVNRRPTDLRAMIDRCLPAAVIPANISVRVEHALRNPVAEIDEDQVIQVLTNLITNAIEAMPAGGTLTLRTAESEDGAEVRFEVADTGVGIPPENRHRIFEPFFTTKQIGKGTGLGLAVAYGIVKMHGGRIEVTSNTDPTQGPTGSVFTVTLPRRGESS